MEGKKGPSFFLWDAPYKKKKSENRSFQTNCGGAKGIRTPGLYNANVARYQLCYSPISYQLNLFRSANVWYYTKANTKKQYLKIIFCPDPLALLCILIGEKKRSSLPTWHSLLWQQPVKGEFSSHTFAEKAWKGWCMSKHAIHAGNRTTLLEYKKHRPKHAKN